MTFNGGSVVFVGDEIVQVPDYIEVVSKEKVKVKVNGGWEGTHIITVTPEDIKEMAEDLGTGIRTKPCIMFKGIGWDWRNARSFIEEIHYFLSGPEGAE